MGNGSAVGVLRMLESQKNRLRKGSQLSNMGEHAFRERPTREVVFSNQYYLTTSGPICSDLKKRFRNRSKEYFRNSEIEGIVIPKGGKAIEEEPFRVFEPESRWSLESVENIPGDCSKTVVSEKSSSLRM